MAYTYGSDAYDEQQVGIFWMFKPGVPAFRRPVSLPPGVATRFQRIGPESALSLAQAMEYEDTAAVRERFALGRHCYAGLVEGEVATYGWVTFDEERIGELGLSIRMQAGEAYIWDCATLPAYRGQRLYPALLAYMIADLSASGVQRIWIGTDVDNVASQKGLAIVGCQPVVDVGITRTATGHTLWMRKRAGASDRDAMDVHHALTAYVEVRP